MGPRMDGLRTVVRPLVPGLSSPPACAGTQTDTMFVLAAGGSTLRSPPEAAAATASC